MMKKLAFLSLLALPALFAMTNSAKAQGGCGPICTIFGSKLHQHGPLFNYGPYYGYYPFEPYGPWTSDLRYNPPVNTCANGNCGGDGRKGLGLHGWGQYALTTLKNVGHRINPLSHKCGGGSCGACGIATGGSTSGVSTEACNNCSATTTSVVSAPGTATVTNGCVNCAPSTNAPAMSQPALMPTPAPATMPAPAMIPGAPKVMPVPEAPIAPAPKGVTPVPMAKPPVAPIAPVPGTPKNLGATSVLTGQVK